VGSGAEGHFNRIKTIFLWHNGRNRIFLESGAQKAKEIFNLFKIMPYFNRVTFLLFSWPPRIEKIVTRKYQKLN
jgi:hypothetical protein